ncbi:helix-turn-helix domain-containing protein [Lactiplantibacillus plantarum]|uniref:helix-turn-helix domain-containing protein n=1 Tax=Lactiplantibacillus plantarum TaxID=1590 RepID=UPI000DD4D51A|nr:helix-turn-helix transcriptional regulator [Lactiplantibacillus plantarum]MCJ1648641.1 helix-turn-helix domain-containing protein [Lactiplantibacillus plantarum subsp. plantarum]MDI5784212.1 helix-turn-helix domain-containing protein [Lactiplantibacillus plantarum]
MTLFDRIKEIAKKRGYSIAEVERKANVSTNYMYQWKTRNPNPETLAAVAKVLGVSVDYLLTGKEDSAAVSDNARPKVQKIARRATKLNDQQLDQLDEVMNAIFKETFGDDDK